MRHTWKQEAKGRKHDLHNIKHFKIKDMQNRTANKTQRQNRLVRNTVCLLERNVVPCMGVDLGVDSRETIIVKLAVADCNPSYFVMCSFIQFQLIT